MGSYRLKYRIGSGGMAEVFEGTVVGAAGFEKKVAVKSILPAYASNSSLVALLIEEARIATVLNHANIVQVMDFGRIGDRYFIVMEYVDGANLEQILDSARQKDMSMPIELACLIAREALCGLAFAQECVDGSGRSLNLIHRDISPPNIMVSRAGEVKLADFGIAKARSRAIVTEAGLIRGKVAYMSPEQAVGAELDGRSDLFSMGVVLHEMLTGRKLFDGENQNEIMEKVRDAEIEPPSRLRPEVPRLLDEVVMQALHREREQRFASAISFERALIDTMHQESLLAAATDLKQWIAPCMAMRSHDPVGAAEQILDFGTSAKTPAGGTRPIAAAGDENRAAATGRERVPGRRRMLLVSIVMLAMALAGVGLYELWPPGEKSGSQEDRGELAGLGPTHIRQDGGNGRRERTFQDAGLATASGADEEDGTDAGEGKEAESDRRSAAHGSDAKRRPKRRGKGSLFLNSEPWAEITIDGRETGITTPTVEGLKLPVGRHTVTLTNPQLELSYSFQVSVQKDKVIKKFVDLRREGVQH